METYDVEVTGIAPIMFNRFYDPASLAPGTVSGKARDAEGREAEALLRLWLLPDGNIGSPGRQIKKAMLDGAGLGNVKIGRKSSGQFIKEARLVQAGQDRTTGRAA